MKLYSVTFVAKNDADDFYAPEDAYVGDNKDRALEQAEEFRHNIKRFADYVRDYNVCVVDRTGATIYSQPFVKVQEPQSHEGKRREKWDEEGSDKK